MRALLAAALTVFCTLASGASFVGLLKGSPAELFDDADLHLFLDTARKALDEGAENQPLAWQNPKTAHRGDMTILKRFQSKGRNCAQLRVHNEAEGRKSTMRHNLCSIDGRWRLVGDLKQGAPK
jgi:surface antigen